MLFVKKKKKKIVDNKKKSSQTEWFQLAFTGMGNVMYKSLILVYETCYVAAAAEQIQEFV